MHGRIQERPERTVDGREMISLLLMWDAGPSTNLGDFSRDRRLEDLQHDPDERRERNSRRLRSSAHQMTLTFTDTYGANGVWECSVVVTNSATGQTATLDSSAHNNGVGSSRTVQSTPGACMDSGIASNGSDMRALSRATTPSRPAQLDVHAPIAVAHARMANLLDHKLKRGLRGVV